MLLAYSEKIPRLLRLCFEPKRRDERTLRVQRRRDRQRRVQAPKQRRGEQKLAQVHVRGQFTEQSAHGRDLLAGAGHERFDFDEGGDGALDVDGGRWVERPGKDVLDRAPDLDFENLGSEGQVGQAEAHHFGQGMFSKLVGDPCHQHK